MLGRLFGRRPPTPDIRGTSPSGALTDDQLTWVRCASVADLHAGEIRPVRVRGGHELALALIDGAVHAFEAYCPHQAWPLKWSEVDKGPDGRPNLLCGLHGWRFCLDTGSILDPPSYDTLTVHPTRIEEGAILVGLPGLI